METGIIINRICGFSKALSENVRVRILVCLQGGPLGLHHFVDIFELAPSTVSKHLHVLEDAGLSVSRREGRWRLYEWPDRKDHETTVALLDWMVRAVQEDPVLQADASRRAVTIQNNPLPEIKSDPKRVLFLCTGNSCRSQMAEGFLRAKGSPTFEVFSAGVTPREIPLMTHQVMREIGIDISGQKPENVMNYIGRVHFEYLITVCPVADNHMPVFPGATRRIHWPIPDPVAAIGTDEEKMHVFRQVRDQLDAAVSNWLQTAASE